MQRILTGAFGAFMAFGGLAFADDASDSARAAALIRQLGDRSFAAREQASVQLTAMGLAAKAALREGVKNADPEVRRRAEQILKIVLAIDFQARLEAFRADKEDKQEHDLAGWKHYRKLVGSDAASRELFIQMLQTNASLLEEAQTKPKEAAEQLANRCQAQMRGAFIPANGGNPRAIQLGDVATALFLEADPDLAIPTEIRQKTCALLYQPALQNGLRNAAPNAPIRKLVSAWLTQCAGTMMSADILRFCIHVDIKEGLGLALKLLKDNDLAQGMAILAVGKWGTKEQLPLLENLLDDKTTLGNFGMNNIRGTTEMRDVALAMLVRRTDQQAKDYGFACLHFHQGQMLFQMGPIWMGFTDDAKRAAAIKKYRDWKASAKK